MKALKDSLWSTGCSNLFILSRPRNVNYEETLQVMTASFDTFGNLSLILVSKQSEPPLSTMPLHCVDRERVLISAASGWVLQKKKEDESTSVYLRDLSRVFLHQHIHFARLTVQHLYMKIYTPVKDLIVKGGLLKQRRNKREM